MFANICKEIFANICRNQHGETGTLWMDRDIKNRSHWYKIQRLDCQACLYFTAA